MNHLALSALAGHNLLRSCQVGSNRETDYQNVVCLIWWRFANRPKRKICHAKKITEHGSGTEAVEVSQIIFTLSSRTDRPK